MVITRHQVFIGPFTSWAAAAEAVLENFSKFGRHGWADGSKIIEQREALTSILGAEIPLRFSGAES